LTAPEPRRTAGRGSLTARSGLTLAFTLALALFGAFVVAVGAENIRSGTTRASACEVVDHGGGVGSPSLWLLIGAPTITAVTGAITHRTRTLAIVAGVLFVIQALFLAAALAFAV
jgi:hypothetical protein